MRKSIVRLIGLLFLILAVIQLCLFVKYWPREIGLFGISLGTMHVLHGPAFYTWDWYVLMYSAAAGYFLVCFKELGRKTALMLSWFLVLSDGGIFILVALGFTVSTIYQTRADPQTLAVLLQLGFIPGLSAICIAILSDKDTKTLFGGKKENQATT